MKLAVNAAERSIIDHIARLPHGRATFKQLVKEMRARGDARDRLESVVEGLVDRGELVELRSGQYTLTRLSREYTVGRLHMHRDGYGFLIPDHPIAGVHGDVFIPADKAEKAMHGDRVVARMRVAADGRADGEIVRVLQRAHATIVGEFRSLRRGNFVVPHDDRIRKWINIPEGMEKPPESKHVDRIGAPPIDTPEEGMIVNVELLEFPSNGEDGVGRIIEVLGHPDDFGVDVEIMIRKHHLPHHFPSEAIEQAESIPQVIRAEDLATRRDFRGMDIVTIDGETARDFDDAVWVDRLANGNFALHVHIADVSHYVRPGTPIDEEARLRGTSVYFPDRAVPMLPLELSTEICSLKPGVDRLVLSALMEIDHKGDIVGQEFHRGVIRSVERMTYTNVHLILEGDAGLRARYASLVPRFELMQELALILNRKRTRRGSIDFDLPEPIIEFDERGQMTGVSRSARNIAHRIIEEFMLSANEAVAGHLEKAEVPSIYRIHETPDPKRVMDFEEIAASFGYSMIGGPMPVKRFKMVDTKHDGRKVRKDLVLADERFSVTSRNYQKLVSKIEGKPEERILSYLMLRSLKQARYSEQNVGHFALASDTYTHFTSPIRRYPDLIVHRVLANKLDNRPSRLDADALHGIAEECSDSERRAADAERELVEWKKIKFMIDRVGEQFPALIISTTRFGFFVELEELFVEGLVPLETLPNEKWTYHENTRKIIGERSRKMYSIGDHVEVILDRVDGVQKKLQFSLWAPEGRGKRTSRKSVR